jgi:hypothetical protein
VLRQGVGDPLPHANPGGNFWCLRLTAIPSQPRVSCLLTSLRFILHPSSIPTPLHFVERYHSFRLYTYLFVISYCLAYYDPSSCSTLNPKFAPCQSLLRSSLPIRQHPSANLVLPRPQTRLLRSRRSQSKLMLTDKQTVTVPLLQRRHPRGSH